MSELDRISFGTDGWRDHRSAFTDTRVRAVASAFADHLHELDVGTDRVAIGYDARRDSPDIARTIAETITAYGFDVWLASRDCPTPAIASVIDEFDLVGGVMVTASHNPPAYNGIKLIPYGGAPALPELTDAIEANLGRETEPEGYPSGSTTSFDFVEHHVETVLSRVDTALHDLTVAYDAMYGSGRGVTDTALERAGANVRRLRCDRKEDFGGDAPEPDEHRLKTLIEVVTSGEADLGIANDGDADRVAIVTPSGFVNAHLLFALMYEDLLKDASGPAVRTVSTTFLIDRIAEAHHEQVIETAVGFKWVAAAMAQHDALIGGEESGGFTVRGHVREKDGPLAALLLADAHHRRSIDERVDDLLDQYGQIFQVTESVDCPDEEKATVLHDLNEQQPTQLAGRSVEAINDTDGLKFLLEDGSWVLIRPSGTEPKLRVYAEAASESSLRALIDAATSILDKIRDS